MVSKHVARNIDGAALFHLVNTRSGSVNSYHFHADATASSADVPLRLFSRLFVLSRKPLKIISVCSSNIATLVMHLHFFNGSESDQSLHVPLLESTRQT